MRRGSDRIGVVASAPDLLSDAEVIEAVMTLGLLVGDVQCYVHTVIKPLGNKPWFRGPT